LKYADHDITDEKKFIELAPNKYLRSYINALTKLVVVDREMWATRLQNASISNLFDIPHFGRSNEINSCVKMLLMFVHGGYLWLDRRISIDIYLIVCIIGISLKWEDPSPLFFDKKNENALSEITREMFHTHRAQHGLDVTSICDPKVRFLMYILACKLLRKCRKDQIPVIIIVVEEKCVEGIQMN